ncbi:sulfate transport system permease protein CysT [Clostridium homopropionicum DSM 5847]|uniref:Sulfate transport system permease protein CysT n=1 Tax=Clostridium homopropionicum DSM 5847 TaxID=1121318 RepID=A0A0L6ZCP5_9CLOT|nr:sulfate ABC transporter permease subunit CysT [Clostridium homopropionicum]KOA20712.1 sulfate transport system permease protein CysT [Clostridium homopropionicum DSM 5847]SFF90917.1 sulfate transport system permease protein [Clostridium homopropionicum]
MRNNKVKNKKNKGKRVIPGFGISIGTTLTLLSLIVLIPMASIVILSSGLSLHELWQIVTVKDVVSAYKVSFSSAFIAALINCIFGIILAWVLVRYEFPGKRILDGLIELPFALPTAVAGIALTALYSDKGWIGSIFAKAGIKIAYTKLGIIIAMVFIGIPFVVRAIQPVLEKLDGQYEEAAAMLGASGRRTFFKVIFPEIFPAMLTGFGLALARGIGEYGSVVFIAGNIPYETQIAPLLIMTKLEQYKYTDATAIALVMLIASFIILLLINMIQAYANKITSN